MHSNNTFLAWRVEGYITHYSEIRTCNISKSIEALFHKADVKGVDLTLYFGRTARNNL